MVLVPGRVARPLLACQRVSMSRALIVSALLLAGCPSDGPLDLADDPVAYIADAPYRRAILERDLTTLDNRYADKRLDNYGLGTSGWDALPALDRPSRPLTQADLDAALAGDDLVAGDALTTLVPASLPETEEEWIALGRRVFFEYPLRADATYAALLEIPGALDDTGWLRDPDGAVVGLRVFEHEDGSTRVGNTCAQCHASYGGRGEPELDGVLSNRAMNVGAARLLVMGLTPGELPPELESTSTGDLDRLGPGRGDVLSDGEFNPYAFPDFGGLGQLPYLHHNANWHHRQTATLAVRCETLFITASGERARIPRVLSWALAVWQRSLPAPAPLESPSPDAARGEEVFAEASCDTCHVPPLYTSDLEIDVESIGTDPSAGLSPVRWSGHYRIPSLRGVGRTAPYLHDGAFESLEAMFSDKRSPDAGHRHGLDLSDADRAALLAFLRSI